MGFRLPSRLGWRSLGGLLRLPLRRLLRREAPRGDVGWRPKLHCSADAATPGRGRKRGPAPARFREPWQLVNGAEGGEQGVVDAHGERVGLLRRECAEEVHDALDAALPQQGVGALDAWAPGVQPLGTSMSLRM